MNKLFAIMRESQTVRFLLPAGLMLTIFGVIVLIISIGNQDYLKVEATVTNVEKVEEVRTDADGSYIEETYNVNVSYEVDGKSYTGELDNVNIYKKGDKMTIYYNPENPSQITQSKSIVIPIIVLAAGVIALVSGVICAIKVSKKDNIETS